MAESDSLDKIPEPVRERVFISGVGPVCPPGIGIKSLATHFWQIANCDDIAEESGQIPDELTVPEFDLSDYVETTRPYIDRHSECMLASASMALGRGGSGERDVDAARCGLTMATMFGNVSSMERFQNMVRSKGMRLASPVLFPHCYANTSNSLLAIEFGLRGYNQNYCGDHLCGATALQTAYEVLKRGRADLMLAGGGDVLSDNFRETLTGDDLASQRPPGEGVAFLGLETEKSLSTRGTRPLCEIAAVVSRGMGIAEPMEVGQMNEQIPALVRAVISETLDEADMWEGDIGAVFLTTPWGVDEWVESALDEAVEDFSALPKFSPVPTVGHTWAAAYPLQCTLGAMALRQGELPTPPELKNVREGVETWMEEGPTALLGEAVLICGCTRRQVVATILKQIE